MKKTKVVVFDFDGTLCDSFESVITLISQRSERYGYDKISVQEMKRFRGMGLLDVIRSLKIPFYLLPFLAYRIRKELGKVIDELPMFPGMKKSMIRLSKKGIKVGILTSNSKKNVERFLDKHEIEVDFMYPRSSLFGKSFVLQKIMKDLEVKKDEILHVGDEVRDILASKEVGVPSLAVTWGYNSREILMEHHPDQIIDHPRELGSCVD